MFNLNCTLIFGIYILDDFCEVFVSSSTDEEALPLKRLVSNKLKTILALSICVGAVCGSNMSISSFKRKVGALL